MDKLDSGLLSATMERSKVSRKVWYRWGHAGVVSSQEGWQVASLRDTLVVVGVRILYQVSAESKGQRLSAESKGTEIPD